MEKNIKDIAREAGVSVATVSKVINGYPHISETTREKVMRVIRDSNFMPNSVARSLVRKRSMTLGLLLTTGLIHPFATELLAGMESALKRSGYDLMYLVQISWDKSYSVVQHCRSRNVEGVLAFGFQYGDLNWESLLQSNIPAIFIDIDLAGKRAGYITSDNVGAVCSAVAHLEGLGHRRIAMLTGYRDSYVSKVRVDAFLREMNRLGFPVPDHYVAASDFTKEGGYQAAKSLLAQPERPTAIVCSSDMEAIGVIDAAKEAGLDVPADLSVVGFDDINLAAYCHPPLTTIRQDVGRLGREALEFLVSLIRQPELPPPKQMIPTELIIRQSTGRAPV